MVKINFDYTHRQQKVLQLLFENKVMTREHISRQVYPGKVQPIISRNLKRLQTEVLIQKTFDSSLARKNVFFYQIYDSGVDVVKKFYPNGIVGHPKRSYAINHDLGLVDLREKLQNKSSVVRYATENMLNFSGGIYRDEFFRSYIELQSDAVLGLKIDNEIQYGALEYEPSVKSLDRYRKKLLDYYLRKDIRFVLYVCTNESTITAIRQIEDELKPNGKTKLYFAYFDNVMKSSDVVTFHGRRDASILIK